MAVTPAQISSRPISLDEVGRRIERWRDTRPYRHAPMPAGLWAAAVAAARQFGLAVTAQRLHVDYGALKKHLETKGSEQTDLRPTFVELGAAAPLAPACVIEIEGRRGTVRIQGATLAAHDLVALAHLAWGGQ